MKTTLLIGTTLLLLTPALVSAQFTVWPTQAGGNGHYYEAVITPGGITWSNAFMVASNRGGYLATITSSNENAFVFALVSNDQDLWHKTVAGNWYGPWLGGFQPVGSPEPAGGWQWVTGEPFGYSNWGSGQPSNSSPDVNGGENRIRFGGQPSLSGKWNDANDLAISNIRGFVIEYDAKPNPEPELFFGEYVSPYPYDLALTVPRPTNLTVVAQAASRFQARLLASGVETFEQYATNTSPAALIFGSLSASLFGTNYIGGVADPKATHVGVFPYSGTNYLNLTANVTITVSFSSPQAAFGFIGTDLETNRVFITLVTVDHGNIQLSVPVTSSQGSGGAFFFGVLAGATPFTAVQITNTGAQSDGCGLDDMVVADARHIISLPSLAINPSSREISWDTVTNAGYQVQFSTNLATHIWMPLNNGYYRGSGGVFSTNCFMQSGEPQRFYKVVVTNSVP